MGSRECSLQFDIQVADFARRNVIDLMLQDCLREFSAFDGGKPGAQGRFDYPYLDAYWQEEGRSPFVFLREGNEIGFAFVRSLGEDEVEMAEFYVVPSFRRTGVAQVAAKKLFDRFSGRWTVRHHEGNEPARALWAKVINEVAEGHIDRAVSGAQLHARFFVQ
jgi:predicted acetyltransferase